MKKERYNELYLNQLSSLINSLCFEERMLGEIYATDRSLPLICRYLEDKLANLKELEKVYKTENEL